jgi:hypothetical protein
MLITFGNTKPLRGKPWFLVDLGNGETIEETLHRLCGFIPKMYRDMPIEVFVPIQHHGLGKLELSTATYIFARTVLPRHIFLLKRVIGIQDVIMDEIKHRPLTVEDKDIQPLINQNREARDAVAKGIGMGDFVRITDGHMKDLCGHVYALKGSETVVRVELRTKVVFVETSTYNLTPLDVPSKDQVWYYNDELIAGVASSLLIRPEDPDSEPELVELLSEFSYVRGRPYTRRQTLTYMVDKLVSGGLEDPTAIARLIVEAIARKEVKPPKNWFILYCLIKKRLTKHFKCFDWRDVVRKKGWTRATKFTTEKLSQIDPSLNIPQHTLEPAKDGRSREARAAKKLALMNKKNN